MLKNYNKTYNIARYIKNYMSCYIIMSSLKIMSFNIAAETLCINNNSNIIIQIIKSTNPDILGIQETNCINEVTNEYTDIKLYDSIASTLNYFYQTNKKLHTVVFSKFPIIYVSDLYKGIVVKQNENTFISLFNIHLTDEPYQPYQINKVPYGDYPFIETEEDAIKFANDARKGEITKILNEISQVDNLYNVSATIVMGDFNEPSHRDWTSLSINAGLHPLKVEFPSVKMFEQAGFIDSFRHIYPDPVKHTGFTWPTPNKYSPKEEIKDRIDFILVKSNKINVVNAAIIGENEFKVWPSDHRACICILDNYYKKYTKYKLKYLDLKIKQPYLL